MSVDLGRRLVTAGLVSPGEVEAALFISVVRGTPLTRVLLERGAITERALEEEIERAFELSQRRVMAVAELVAQLPKAMCRRLAAVPTQLDPDTNTVDIAAADPLDPHIAIEFGFHLGTSIRVLRAPIAAVEEALRKLELAETELPSTPQALSPPTTQPFPHGSPQSGAARIVDETPIPLVRKLPSLPPPDGDALEGTLQSASSDENTVPLPLRNAKFVPLTDRAPLTREQGSTTFPSPPPEAMAPQPPPSRGGPRSETPPYGSQVIALGRPFRRPPQEAVSASPAAEGDASTVEKPPRTLRPPLMAPAAPPDPAREPPRAPAPRPVTIPLPAAAPETAPSLTPAPTPAVMPMPIAAPEVMPMPIPALPPEVTPTPPAPVAPHRAAPPKAPGALPTQALSLSSLLPLLSEATSRDEVVRLALRGLLLVARRAAVFAVRREGFHGWACNAEFGDLDALRALTIRQEQPSVLATSAVTGLYLGPIPATPAHNGLIQIMKQRSSEVAVSTVRVGGRAAMILLADELRDPVQGTRFIEELSRALGDALTRLLSG